MNQLFISIGSCILTVFAIILAVFFYIKSRRNKRPVYIKRSANIIQDFSSKLSDLIIKYKNETVINLTITKITFWNDGRETINNTDIAEADPIRILASSDTKILSAKVIYCSNPANRFCISDIEDGNSFKLSFDYIDKNEGGIVQIIHTGKSSQDINVKGIIKGAGNPVLRYVPTSVPSKFSNCMTAGIFLGFLGLSIFFAIRYPRFSRLYWIAAFFFGVITIGFIFALISERDSVPRMLHIPNNAVKIEYK